MGRTYTAPQNYTDIDGQAKTFTVVDHDVKVSGTPLSSARAYKERVDQPLSPEEVYCHSIMESEITSSPQFIARVDELLSQFGIERHRKGSPIEISCLLVNTEVRQMGFYHDLSKVFQESLDEEIKRLSNYKTTKYEGV